MHHQTTQQLEQHKPQRRHKQQNTTRQCLCMWYPRLQPPSLMPVIRGHHHCHYGYQQVAIKDEATTPIAINKLPLRPRLQPPSLMLTYVTQWTRLTYTTTTTTINNINSSFR